MTNAPWFIISPIAPVSSFGSRSAIQTILLPLAPCGKTRTDALIAHQPLPRPGGGPLFVEIHDELFQHRTVSKRYDPSAGLQSRIEDKAGHKPLVQGTNVSNCGPGLLGSGLRQDLSLNRSHWTSIGQNLAFLIRRTRLASLLPSFHRRPLRP